MMITENEIIDVEEYEELDNSAMFQTKQCNCGAFRLLSILLSYCRLNTEVWWGYRWFYNLSVFLPAFILAAVLDVVIIIVGWALAQLWQLVIIDLLVPLFKRFTMICVTAAAVLVIILVIYNLGWDGLNNLFKGASALGGK